VQIAKLEELADLSPTLAGLAKMHNTSKARQVLAEARDLLGGNGILLDYHVIRHMTDIEAIHTFAGGGSSGQAEPGQAGITSRQPSAVRARSVLMSSSRLTGY
jgi:alkylation response protein AidB-like acyl-CoA dehydrogenase